MGNESDAREKRDIFHVRIKMLCANNQLYATKAMPSGFVPPYTQKEGLARTLEFEFVRTIEDAVEFASEEMCNVLVYGYNSYIKKTKSLRFELRLSIK